MSTPFGCSSHVQPAESVEGEQPCKRFLDIPLRIRTEPLRQLFSEEAPLLRFWLHVNAGNMPLPALVSGGQWQKARANATGSRTRRQGDNPESSAPHYPEAIGTSWAPEHRRLITYLGGLKNLRKSYLERKLGSHFMSL